MVNKQFIVRHLQLMIDRPLTLHLFVDESDSNNPKEPDGGGYKTFEYRARDWTISETEARAEGTVSEFRFDGTKEILVRGAFMTDASGGIVWEEPFREPITVRRRGDIIPVRPIMRVGAMKVS